MTSVVTAVIVAIVGVCVGAALVWLLMRPRLSAAYEQGKPTKTMPPKVGEFSGDDEERAPPTIEAKVETA